VEIQSSPLYRGEGEGWFFLHMEGNFAESLEGN